MVGRYEYWIPVVSDGRSNRVMLCNCAAGFACLWNLLTCWMVPCSRNTNLIRSNGAYWNSKLQTKMSVVEW